MRDFGIRHLKEQQPIAKANAGQRADRFARCSNARSSCRRTRGSCPVLEHDGVSTDDPTIRGALARHPDSGLFALPRGMGVHTQSTTCKRQTAWSWLAQLEMFDSRSNPWSEKPVR
jgi:hypothetical protein